MYKSDEYEEGLGRCASYKETPEQKFKMCLSRLYELAS